MRVPVPIRDDGRDRPPDRTLEAALARKRRDTRLPAPFLRHVGLREDAGMGRGGYPFDQPWLKGLDLEFTTPVTVITGENGTGKSTLIEAIASMETAQKTKFSLSFDSLAQGRWRGDGKRIRQVLSNLVNNAVKFTGEGHVEISVTLADGSVRFDVKDDGPGVPSDKLQAIFNRFQQVEETESRRHGGVGIGLNISQQLVHAMGGRIGVESEEGSGALFWFELPLQRAAALKSA
ncbi:MAG: ATP-binding protein [Pseudomonadota bacterium]